MIVGDAAFVLGIIKLVSHVDQQGLPAADHFITVSDAGRNENLPRAQRAHVKSIAQAKRGRTPSEIDERDLEEAFGWSPAVWLMEVIVEGLDGSGIVQSSGNLRRRGGKISGQAATKTLN